MQTPVVFGPLSVFFIYHSVLESLGKPLFKTPDSLKLNPFDGSDEILAELWNLGNVVTSPKDHIFQPSVSGNAASLFPAEDNCAFQVPTINASTLGNGSLLDEMVPDSLQKGDMMHKTEPKMKHRLIDHPEIASTTSNVLVDQTHNPPVVSLATPSSNDYYHEKRNRFFENGHFDWVRRRNTNQCLGRSEQCSGKDFIAPDPENQNQDGSLLGSSGYGSEVQPTDLAQLGHPLQARWMFAPHFLAAPTNSGTKLDQFCFPIPKDFQKLLQGQNDLEVSRTSSKSVETLGWSPRGKLQSPQGPEFIVKGIDRINPSIFLEGGNKIQTNEQSEKNDFRLKALEQAQLGKGCPSYLKRKNSSQDVEIVEDKQFDFSTCNTDMERHVKMDTKGYLTRSNKQFLVSRQKPKDSFFSDLDEFLRQRFPNKNHMMSFKDQRKYESIKEFLNSPKNQDIETAKYDLAHFWYFVAEFLENSQVQKSGTKQKSKKSVPKNSLEKVHEFIKTHHFEYPEDLTDKNQRIKIADNYSEMLSLQNLLISPSLHQFKKMLIENIKFQINESIQNYGALDLDVILDTFQWMEILSARFLFQMEFLRRIFVPNNVEDLETWIEEGRDRGSIFLSEFWKTFKFFEPIQTSKLTDKPDQLISNHSE